MFGIEVYSELYQARKMKLICETSKQLKAVNFFRKNSILDVWQGSDYTLRGKLPFIPDKENSDVHKNNRTIFECIIILNNTYRQNLTHSLK